MNLGLLEIKTQQRGVFGYPSYSASAVKNNTKPVWDGYFNSKDVDNNKVNTVDAMTALNAVNKTENTREVQKKNKAMIRMSKLSDAMQKKNFLKLTQKHCDALNLLQANPALSSHISTIEEKLQGITKQNVYFIQKLELASSQDLSADEINKICNDITNSAKQLEKDAQVIRTGILKAGAYSEAMMKIDDPEKKDKYEKAANEIISSLPDAFKNKAEASEVQEQLFNNAEDDIDVQDENLESDIDTEVGDFQSPFLYDEDGSLLIEKIEADVGITIGEDKDIDSGESLGIATSEQAENDIDKQAQRELEKIHKEYKKDLELQKAKTGKEPEPIKNEKGIAIKSLLDEE